MSRCLIALREKLSKLLNNKINNVGLVNKQLAIFDHIVSRRQFLGGAGKLSALTMLINSGLAPSVWASQSPQYQVTDENLQLSDEEQAEMARAATMTLSGELIDDQLLIKTGGEITNTDNHHTALYAGHPLPYIQTSADEVVLNTASPTQIELISLDSDAVIRHTYRDYSTGHGFITQEVANLSALTFPSGLELSNINNCRIHAFNHPMSGKIDQYGYTVDMMMVTLVDPNNNIIFFYKTRRVKFNNGLIIPDEIIDTGWKQYFSFKSQKLIQILIKDGYPYLLMDDITDINIISFSDLYVTDDDFNPYCPLRISKISNPSKLFFTDSYTTNSTFDNSHAIRLFNIDRSTGQYSLLFLPNQSSGLASGTDIWYSCQNYNGGSSAIYLEGGNVIRKSLFTTPNDNVGYSTCKLTGDNDSTGSFYEENLTTSNGLLAGNIKCIKLQRNSDGLHTIYATSQNEKIYKLRQYSQKADDDSLTSPFVAASYVLSNGTYIEGAFECNGGLPDTAQWSQLYENMFDILVPPLSDNESDYFTISGTGYSLYSVEKYTLMSFSENLMMPMSEDEITANTNLATEQITDTFFHGEINVLDTSGLPVKDGIKVELRASRTCRIIDNKSKYAHTITRSQSAVLETNALGRVIISTRADDMTAPTLFARIYDDNNSLSITNNCVELSEEGGQHEWCVLNPDSDAHTRMADTTYTTTDSLTQAGIITSDVPSGTQNDVTQIIQSAGSALATTVDSATPEDELQSSEWKTQLSPLTHTRKISLRNRKWKAATGNTNATISFSFPQHVNISGDPIAMTNYGASIYHSIGHFFSDVIHSLKHNVTILIDGIAREITRAAINFGNEVTAAYYYIENGVEKSVQFILDTAEHIAQAVTSIITKITSYAGDL
uniref:hypothetical protein n=1 Tax=Vibrio sp. V23_P3S9T160 TaxID=1938675 RepID=UPI00137241AE